jgi:general stress protein YciG
MEEVEMANQQNEKGGQGTKQGAEGQKGVSQDTVGAGKDKDPNNFANNPDRAAEAGRKGGQARKS